MAAVAQVEPTSDVTVGLLREAFRNLQAWRGFHEDTGKDTLELGSSVLCLWDIEYLYERGLPLLPPRQRQAIQLFLVGNIREREVAEMMGVKDSNPIGSYATLGLEKLVEYIAEGTLPRFQAAAAWGTPWRP